MQKSGRVSISNGVPSLNGERLAICDDPSPFTAAARFLGDRGIRDNDQITVTGEEGSIGNVSVFCMTDAQSAGSKALSARDAIKAAARTKPRAGKKATAKKAAPNKKNAANKAAKKSAPTQSAKRGRR